MFENVKMKNNILLYYVLFFIYKYFKKLLHRLFDQYTHIRVRFYVELL